MEFTTLEESVRVPTLPDGAVLDGPVPGQRRIRVVVGLRRRPPGAGNHEGILSPAQHEERFGADPADMALVRSMAEAQGLDVTEFPRSRLMILEGTLSRQRALFPIELRLDLNNPALRLRKDAIQIPTALKDIVIAVMGFDNRPQVDPHISLSNVLNPPEGNPFPDSQIPPAKVASLYRFPQESGEGATIAILEFGGGFRTSDIDASLRIQDISNPFVCEAVRVGSSPAPQPGSSSAHKETALDIQVALSVAPAARIVVYFGGLSDAEVIETVAAAVHADRPPTVVSMSWGTAEERWSPQCLRVFGDLIDDAARLGIPFLVSSGDSGPGSANMEKPEFPASHPNATACGGTQFSFRGPGQPPFEEAWSRISQGQGSGGGFSRIFKSPSFQVPFMPQDRNGARGIPDIAGYASGEPGYLTIVNGVAKGQSGTSAVAPLYAGLIARVAGEKLIGRPFNEIIYGMPPEAFRDILSGGVAPLPASQNWDPTSGRGSVMGQRFSAEIAAHLVDRPV